MSRFPKPGTASEARCPTATEAWLRAFWRRCDRAERARAVQRPHPASDVAGICSPRALTRFALDCVRKLTPLGMTVGWTNPVADRRILAVAGSPTWYRFEQPGPIEPLEAINRDDVARPPN